MEEEFSLLLIEDLNLFEVKRDMVFVNEFMTPLLNSEKKIPITFHIFDEDR